MSSVIDQVMSVSVKYFQFEEDFMEDNIRCIPMIVRFKLDACGIKLKLKEWSKMNVEERERLATLSIDSSVELDAYRDYLESLVFHYTQQKPTYLSPEQQNASWSVSEQLPSQLLEMISKSKTSITVDQWKNLDVLQRYALLKLSRPGHENKNFPKALKEFGLI